MWQPVENLGPSVGLLKKLEQLLLAVYTQKQPLEALTSFNAFADLWAFIDEQPYQAVALTRIKVGHAMAPRHGVNVMLLARAWAVCKHRLGKQLDSLSLAALIHDVGQAHLPDLIYEQDFFSHEQMRLLQTHPQAALQASFVDSNMQRWIREHHEQPDGKGYPEGIRSPHLISQLLRIVDCYDGLTTPRRFRQAYTPHRALVLMARWAGFKFDAGLFKGFRNFMGVYPVGSCVRLVDGEVAFTINQIEGEQVMLVVTNEDGDALASPQVLKKPLQSIKGEARPWQHAALKGRWRNLRPDWLQIEMDD